MKIHIAFSLLGLSILSLACSDKQSGSKAQNQLLANRVMELHDSAMVHASRILKLKSRANLEVDSLENLLIHNLTT